MLFDVKLKKTWFPGLKAQAHVSVFQPGVSRQARRTATTLSVAYAWDIVTVRGTIFFGLDLKSSNIGNSVISLFRSWGKGEGAVISGVPKSRASTSIRIKH